MAPAMYGCGQNLAKQISSGVGDGVGGRDKLIPSRMRSARCGAADGAERSRSEQSGPLLQGAEWPGERLIGLNFEES